MLNAITKNAGLAAVAGAALAIVFAATSPQNASPQLLMVVFGLVYVLGVNLVAVVIGLLHRYGLWPAGLGHTRRIAYLVGLVPCVLLVMNSVGQVTVRDLLLMAVFFGLLYLYFSRSLFRTSPEE